VRRRERERGLKHGLEPGYVREIPNPNPNPNANLTLILGENVPTILNDVQRRFADIMGGKNFRKDKDPVEDDSTGIIKSKEGNNRSLTAHDRTEWMTKMFLDRITLTMHFPKGNN
jgi:hypothetical protein